VLPHEPVDARRAADAFASFEGCVRARLLAGGGRAGLAAGVGGRAGLLAREAGRAGLAAGGGSRARPAPAARAARARRRRLPHGEQRRE